MAGRAHGVTRELGSVRRGRVPPARILTVAAFGAFLAFLDATIVNVAFPSIRESFPDADISSLSWVLNAYNIVFGAFMVPAGRLADLIGRRRSFLGGVLLFTLASAACALAPSVATLIVFRIVQALGAAMLVPASLALVVQAFEGEHRTHAVGLWGAAAAVAAGLGPPIGGFLIEVGDWRWAFLVNLPVGLAAYLVARRSLVESRAPGRRTMPDLAGSALFALSLGLLTLGIVQGNDWSWTSIGVLASFAGALVVFGAFIVSSRRHRSPLLDPQLLRVRAFVVTNAATIVAGLGFYAYLLTNILWLTYVWGYSILAAGLAVAPGAVVAAVVAGVLGPLAAKRGYRLIVVLGPLIWAAAFVWYATRVGTEPDFLGEWLPGQVLSGIGSGATLPLLTSAGLVAVPGGRFATASAMLSSSRQVGGTLGIALLVAIIGTPTPATVVEDLRLGWWMSVVAFVAAAVIALLLGRVEPAPEQPADPVSSRVDLHLPEPVAEPNVVGGITTHQLFTSLPEPVREALDTAAQPVHLEAGRWLFQAGDDAGAVYVVTSGRLEVVVDGDVVRTLGPGEVVGELALLTGESRSASVRAARDTVLSEVSRTDFELGMQRDPHSYAAMASVLAAELRDARPPVQRSGDQPKVVAVVGLHPGAPVEEVCAALLAGLRAQGLTADRLTDPSAEALERAETALDRVVLCAGADDASRAFAERQSDHVVLVASSGEPPVARAGRGGADLILVGQRPSEDVIRAWCDAVDPWQMTTIEGAVDPASMRALAARIAGRSIGVVMAGGGARALAHVGVLQVLTEAGLAIDRVAGCSVGSIVAGFYAAGLDPEPLQELMYDELVRGNPFGDYTFPTVSLAKGRRHRRALTEFLGGREIRALPRQFRCVSVDLRGRSTVAHRSGDLAQAVSASVALPILFPPLRTESTLLIDGGILDNLPVGLLTERSEGPVVAVNIAMGGGEGTHRSGPPRIPGLGDTLLRVMMIGSGGAVKGALDRGAIVVTPPPLGVGLLEFHQFDTVVEGGRVAARRLLDEAGSLLT